MPSWKRQASVSGIVSAKSISNAASEVKKPHRESKGTRIDKDKADVCLTCRKKRCDGRNGCFKKRKKELTCEESGV